MKNRFKTCIAALLLAATHPVYAVETIVLPGVGTLESAIAAASDGDVLILQTGTYTASTPPSVVDIDKSITIRAVSRPANPVITADNFGISTGKSVTIQGVQIDVFNAFLCSDAASVRLLENTISSLTTNVAINCSTDELTMVGNTIMPGPTFNPRDITTDVTNAAYIAGNTLPNGAIIVTGPEIWIVGNAVAYSSNGTIAARALIDVVTNNRASVIGNRLTTPRRIPHDTNQGWTGIRVEGNSLVASNVISPEVADGAGDIRGIWKPLTTGSMHVLNNVYYRNDRATDNTPAIEITGPGRISGNIVVGHHASTTIWGFPATVSHNICYNNDADCGTDDGNLASNPKFVDTVDFKLDVSSPGINAGPVEYQFADLDRSRNDIGAYGGPWQLGQYDAQRNSSLLAPYVYPLFDTNSAINDGNIHVRSLGVARLR
jgi:hypothetical protein